MSKSIEADVKCMSIFDKNYLLLPLPFFTFLSSMWKLSMGDKKINQRCACDRIWIINFVATFVLLHGLGVYKAKIKEIHQKMKDNNVQSKNTTPQNVQTKITTPQNVQSKSSTPPVAAV